MIRSQPRNLNVAEEWFQSGPRGLKEYGQNNPRMLGARHILKTGVFLEIKILGT